MARGHCLELPCPESSQCNRDKLSMRCITKLLGWELLRVSRVWCGDCRVVQTEGQLVHDPLRLTPPHGNYSSVEEGRTYW